jgi:tetratricopeptide (TPR) repeat protein
MKKLKSNISIFIYFLSIIFILIVTPEILPFYQESYILGQETQSNFQKGEQYYIEGKFQIAKIFLEKALTEDPENYIIYYYLGNIYFLEQNYEVALSYYLKGVEFNKNVATFYYNIGLTYYNLFKFEEAINWFLKVLELQPTNGSVFLNLGFCYYFLKDKDNTLKYWKLYVEYPTDPVKKEKILYFISVLSDPNFKFPENMTASSSNTSNSSSSSSSGSSSSSSTSSSSSSSSTSSTTSSSSSIDTTLIDTILQSATTIDEVPPEPTDSEEAL